MKNKKMTRTCVGCKIKKDKQELIRIVKNKENEILVDFEQKIAGRGAYICKDIKCLKRIQKSNRLKMVLRTNVDNEKYDELRFENI